jgi:hypothetical protein
MGINIGAIVCMQAAQQNAIRMMRMSQERARKQREEEEKKKKGIDKNK